MNWLTILPEVIGGTIVVALSALSASLYAKLHASRQQLGYAKDLGKRLRQMGLSNVYETRSDYSKYRGASRLADYLALAADKIIISGYWLAQGSELEGVSSDLGRFLTQHEHLQVTVVVVDPDADYAKEVAAHMQFDEGALRARARASISALRELQTRLAPDTASRLVIRKHRTYPILSIIVLDPDSSTTARIQMDVKPYGIPRSASIGFEFRNPEAQAFRTLLQSCMETVRNSVRVDDEHL